MGFLAEEGSSAFAVCAAYSMSYRKIAMFSGSMFIFRFQIGVGRRKVSVLIIRAPSYTTVPH
jgi:hypothetical protein